MSEIIRGIFSVLLTTILISTLFFYIFNIKGPWGGFWTFFLAKECEYAAITAGADGLYLSTNGGSELVHAQCAVDQVYSSVGSGDCLLAGLAVAFKNGMNMEGAARFAVACGAANCIREDLGMLCHQDVEMLEKQVVLKTYRLAV